MLHRLSDEFVVSGSSDLTIKIWRPVKATAAAGSEDDKAAARAVKWSVKFTTKAHDKEINNIDISPNDKLFATASHDKLAKVGHSTVKCAGE